MNDTVSTRSFDAVELELLWRRLISLVDEAAAALVRTSFSTWCGNPTTSPASSPMRRGSPWCRRRRASPPSSAPCRDGEALHPAVPVETLQPGDVLITNDLWLGTGHLPDITVAKPIFPHGRVVAFSASTAHAPDIGGKIRSPEPREVFEEGLQIPPMRLMRAGVTDETLVAIIRQNVRTPEQTMGDLWAQVVART